MQQAVSNDYVDLVQLPTLLQQLSHSAKELQTHQKNMGTQYAALKHEFDQSVRAAGAKTRELEKADKELQKNASDHTKHLAKLTTQMQAADAMVDAVKEATRKVKMQEERMVKMEDRAEGIEQQLEDVAEMRRLADTTRADTDDILPRLTTAESNVVDLLAKVSEAQARADEAHERINGLKEELDYERDERVRIEDEHAASMNVLRSDLALLVNALGGRFQLDLEDFKSIAPPKKEGLLDATEAKIKNLYEGQARMVSELQRLQDLESRCESMQKELNKTEAQIKTIVSIESELTMKLSSYDKWKEKTETKMDFLDEAVFDASKAAGAAAAAAAAFSVLSAAKSESDSADPTPASVVGQTRLKRTLSDSKGAPTVTAPSEADGAQAKAAAAVAASLATLQQAQMAKGVSKEHMDEIVSDLRETIGELETQIKSAQEEIQTLKTEMKQFDTEMKDLDTRCTVAKAASQAVSQGKGEGETTDAAASGGNDEPSSNITKSAEVVAHPENQGDERNGQPQPPNVPAAGVLLAGQNAQGGPIDDEGKEIPGGDAADATPQAPTSGHDGSKLNIPQRPAGAGLKRHNAAAPKNVAKARAQTNEEIIQQQGETIVLMYNEVSQLRKEIRAIRSSNRPSLLSGTRVFSPWALKDPFRKLEPGQEICVFPDGTDRDINYGWMPVAARNILSDPDVEQFMRDAIYMLHRELSQLRKDVDKFKLTGDPAMLAAVKAGDDAKEALALCAGIRSRMKSMGDDTEHKLERLTETVHHNRHDMLERLKKAKDEMHSEKFTTIDLELRRMHTDVCTVTKAVESLTVVQDKSFKGVTVRLRTLEELTGATTTSRGGSLKQGVGTLNQRVDALDAILMDKVRENQAKEAENAFKTKFAYSFDFSQDRGGGNKGSERIFADRTPDTRIFDVQKLELYTGGSGAPQKRPASARIIRPQSARPHRPPDGGETGEGARSSAEHVHAIHRSSDHVMASFLPLDAGGGWTRSGRVITAADRRPANSHQHHQQAPPPFKARQAPKVTRTASEAAQLAVAEAKVEGERIAAAAHRAEKAKSSGSAANVTSSNATSSVLQRPSDNMSAAREISSTEAGTMAANEGILLLPRQRERAGTCGSDIQPWTTRRMPD